MKYCSDKCKRHKPSPAAGSVDIRIENTLLALLQGNDPKDLGIGAGSTELQQYKLNHKAKKGDPRFIVKISDIETAVFGNTPDPDKVYGRKKNRAKRGLPDPEEWRSVDMEDASGPITSEPTEAGHVDSSEDIDSNSGDEIALRTRIRPPQSQNSFNGSIGGEKGWSERTEESPEMLQKRREGQKRAENQELVKNAARRAVVFGLLLESPPNDSKRQARKGRTGEEQSEKVRRKCEALMHGSVVEPSFAKGDWSIRWRED